MRNLSIAFATIMLLGASFTSFSQDRYILSKFGERVDCDELVENECYVDGKLTSEILKNEVVLAKDGDDIFIYENDFFRGEVIMASDDAFLTRFEFTTMWKKELRTENYLYFVNRKDYSIAHKYNGWYLEGGQTLEKFFPPNAETCPSYAQAFADFKAVCEQGIRAPQAEGRALVRQWNKCHPVKMMDN